MKTHHIYEVLERALSVVSLGPTRKHGSNPFPEPYEERVDEAVTDAVDLYPGDGVAQREYLAMRVLTALLAGRLMGLDVGRAVAMHFQAVMGNDIPDGATVPQEYRLEQATERFLQDYRGPVTTASGGAKARGVCVGRWEHGWAVARLDSDSGDALVERVPLEQVFLDMSEPLARAHLARVHRTSP